MKSRISLSLLGMGLFAGATMAQPRIVLQGSGAPQVFTDLSAAMSAAQPDDKLYFSGGTFTVSGDLIVDRPLHFVGAGTSPDSTAVTGITTISTSSETEIHTAGTGSTFTGIRFTNTVQFGTGAAEYSPTGIVFQRCEFVSYVHLGPGSSSTFDESLFRFRFYGYSGAATVTRCIFTYGGNATHQPISEFDTGGLLMDQCVVLGGRLSNSPNSTVQNCIFTRTSAPFWQSGGSILTNNLCVSTVLTSNMTPGSDVGNVLGVLHADIFVNETNGYFEWTDDLHLQSSSVGIGMATDGTDVGIYGSSSPYKSGAVPYDPHFRSATIAPATTPNGDLPVNIRVAAQTH